MSVFRIQLNTADVERAIRVLKAKAPIAIVRALNKSIESAKVAMAREVATDMGMKIGDVKKRIGVTPARSDNFIATLHAHGTPIPLIEFGATGPKPSRGKGRGVSAKTGLTRKSYPGAFITTVASAAQVGMGVSHTGVFRRAGTLKRKSARAWSKNLPIVELHGPSIAYIFGKHVAVGIARAEEQLVKNLKSEFRFATGQTGKIA